eukprot:SAG31_NODE_27898_length_418_cov_1.373041_1_plen_62_part_10
MVQQGIKEVLFAREDAAENKLEDIVDKATLFSWITTGFIPLFWVRYRRTYEHARKFACIVVF